MQHFLKFASGATGTRIISAQLLKEFLIPVYNAETHASRLSRMGSPCGVYWLVRRGIRLSSPFSFRMDLPVTSRKAKGHTILLADCLAFNTAFGPVRLVYRRVDRIPRRSTSAWQSRREISELPVIRPDSSVSVSSLVLRERLGTQEFHPYGRINSLRLKRPICSGFF